MPLREVSRCGVSIVRQKREQIEADEHRKKSEYFSLTKVHKILQNFSSYAPALACCIYQVIRIHQ